MELGEGGCDWVEVGARWFLYNGNIGLNDLRFRLGY